MPYRRLVSSFVTAFALTAVAQLLVTSGPIGGDDTYRIPAAVPRRATMARLLERAQPSELVPMSITLHPRDPDALQALIAAQQQAGSAAYHQWLTPAEFATRFGPSAEVYADLVGWLQGEGFTVQTWPSRLRIDFSGSVGRVEHTFDVRMNHYRNHGRDHIANADPPRMPIRFAGVIRHVRLNTFPLAKPLLRVTAVSGIDDVLAPQDAAVVYNSKPLLDRGIDGAGQTLAVVARSDFNTGDVLTFQQQFGVTVRAPVKVFPAGNPGIGASAGICKGLSGPDRQDCIHGELGEVELDLELASAAAPGATVLADIGNPDIDVSLADIVNHHPEAKAISMSFGACERLDTEDQQLFGGFYAQAAAQGQTVLVATGDDGADDCADGRGASVNVLATDPNATAVGGTALDPGFDPSGNATGYVSETVWNDSHGSSGGGVSVLVAKPDYQAVLTPADGFRDVPDVTLAASPATPGFAVILDGALVIVGGTSAATPIWAGFVTLLNHATPQTNGWGAINANLYTLGQQQYAAGGTPVFHDVVIGDNSSGGVAGFSAGPGYDLVSGLGSPDVASLIQALSPSCPGDCNGNGTVTVEEIVIGVQIAFGETTLSACPTLDTDGDGKVTIPELVVAVNKALTSC